MLTRFKASPSSWSSGQGLGRIVDQCAVEFSVAFTKAAAELGMIARECHRLALKTGDRNLIGEAEASLEMVAGFAQARDYYLSWLI
jgi:hypothetical protein